MLWTAPLKLDPKDEQFNLAAAFLCEVAHRAKCSFSSSVYAVAQRACTHLLHQSDSYSCSCCFYCSLSPCACSSTCLSFLHFSTRYPKHASYPSNSGPSSSCCPACGLLPHLPSLGLPAVSWVAVGACQPPHLIQARIGLRRRCCSTCWLDCFFDA